MEYIEKYYFSCDPDLNFINTSYCGVYNGNGANHYGPTVGDRYILTYVKSGKGSYTIDNKTYNLKAGCSFIIFPGHTFSHAADKDDPWHYCWIEIYGNVIKKLLNLAELTPDNPVHKHLNLISTNQIINELFLIHTSNNIDSELYRIGLIYKLFIDMINNKGRNHIESPLLHHSQTNKYIKKSITYITQNYSNSLSINDIAEYVGLDRSYFSRLFKDVTGVLPSNYILTYRMSKAKSLLMYTNYKIDEIAYRVGYKSAFQFSKMFKMETWMTPSAYRKTR